MERLSPPVGQIVRRLSAIIRQVIVGEFCGRIMCMLSIGGLDRGFVTALFEQDLRANAVRVCREGKPVSRPHQVRAGAFRIKLWLDAVEKRGHDRP
jgi:hypothetical protein